MTGWKSLFALLSCVMLCLCLASCGPEGKPAADDHTKFNPQTGTGNSNLADDMPVPPADAQFTIVCRDFAEPTHVQDSRQAQQTLIQATNLKKWYIVHAADHSTLYYGFYRSMDPRDANDGPEGQRAINDLNTIRAIQDSSGNRLFSASLLVGIDSPDPQANPAWDITKTSGAWSIEIAAFKDTPDRKQRAVDAVREARNEGVEAYYYHGPTVSSVCVGCWPTEAAIEITPDQLNVNPDEPLLVTPTPLSPEYTKNLGKGIQQIAPHVDVADPTLTQALGKWKEHSVNGYTLMQKGIDPVTHQETSEPERPFLFKIPHKDPLDTMTPADTATVAPPVENTQPKPSGVGQLPSLGD